MNTCRFEVVISFILWIGAVFYSLSGVIHARKAFENFDDIYGDFEDSWLIKGTIKDAADYEWQTTIKFVQQLWPYLVVHIVISEYLRKIHIKVVSYWQLVIAITYIIYSTGIFGLIVMMVQPLMFECIHKFKSKTLVWICSGSCLALICYLKQINFNENQVIQITDNQHYIIIVAVYWINLRCISYYLDNVDSMEHSFLNLLSYCFYLPTLFLGPYIPFSSYKKSNLSYKTISLRERTCTLLYSILRFGFWFIVTEFWLHYFYVNVLSYHPELVKTLDNWSLYGYGYCMGQFFHLKYVVLYGLSTSLSQFEHIETPSIPKCIGRIHLYSDMWKHFDGGLYKFLVRYIYLPSLKNPYINSKIFSSFLCFLFVFVWHGVQYHILVWTVANFLGICIENTFSNIDNYLQCYFYSFNEKWKHRLLCIITSPLLAMSAVSNFYFFAGMKIGNIFVDRFLNSSALANLTLLFFLSCCCQVSIKVKKWEENSQNQNIKHRTSYDSKKEKHS